MPKQEPWVSVEDVAKYQGIAKVTVYRRVDSKNLPAHRIGRLWKFKLADINNWVRDGGTEEKSGEHGK